MPIFQTKFVQKQYTTTKEWLIVSEIADDLFSYLSIPIITEEIDRLNKPKVHSKKIQDVLLRRAREIGFKDESKDLFKDYINKLRPDFYLPIKDTGIIIEVERGKTNQNNMDFLDFWKCHICEKAHYLFLYVPNLLVQNEATGKIVGRPYIKVIEHMTPFFESKNYTHVRGLVVVGY